MESPAMQNLKLVDKHDRFKLHTCASAKTSLSLDNTREETLMAKAVDIMGATESWVVDQAFSETASVLPEPDFKAGADLKILHVFPNLPAELRVKIIQEAIQGLGPRFIEIFRIGEGPFFNCPIPSALHVNQEFRIEALKNMRRSEPHWIYLGAGEERFASLSSMSIMREIHFIFLSRLMSVITSKCFLAEITKAVDLSSTESSIKR